MTDLLKLILGVLASLFRSELRQQINVVCTKNLNPNVLMMKFAQDSVRTYDAWCTENSSPDVMMVKPAEDRV